MSGKILNFRDEKIKENDFYKNKKVAKIDDIDVNKILVSKEEQYSTKKNTLSDITIIMLLDHYA